MSAALKLTTQRQFSKAATNYQQHARVQAASSTVLLDHIGARHLGVCLDLGAGPGVNSHALSVRAQQLVSLDLSESMLQCARTLGGDDNQVVCADMDTLPIHSAAIDTVFSNFAMQWSADLAALLCELHRILTANGRAYIAVVSEGSLEEVKAAFATAGVSAINQFIRVGDLTIAAKQAGFKVQWQHQAKLFDRFDSAKQALKSLSAIGANSCEHGHRHLSKNQYMQILNHLQGSQPGVELSYSVAFLELIK